MRSTILQLESTSAVGLALTSGVVPPQVAGAAIEACFRPDGRVQIGLSGKLSRKMTAELRRWGTQIIPSFAQDPQRFTCWYELLPILPEPQELDIGQQTAVLFELAPQRLADLALEMLRLGNDRQSFSYFGDNGQPRALLRVVGPPYYSLLRALEDNQADDDAPRAYLEQAPRVWIQVGFQHSLAAHLQPPPNHVLLLRPPRHWTYVAESPFRDIYEILDFRPPAPSVAWQPQQLGQRIQAPLRLTSCSSQDPAELWVLRDGGGEQLEQLVRGADDALLARLSFAVGRRGDQETIVLRARPSKSPPPVLVLEGVAFRSYLMLPNLFAPVGTRLHPPLRRDAVARLLAEQRQQITWLYPDQDGGFTPESLPDSAFRPLSDWVDYVMDREKTELDAWVASHRFEFESFVCREEQEPKRRAPKTEKKSSQQQSPQQGEAAKPTAAKPLDAGSEVLDAEAIDRTAEAESHRAPPPDAKRLHELEQRFLALEEPLDGDQRRQLWCELAECNGKLARQQVALICWCNALWETSGSVEEERLRRRWNVWAEEESSRFAGAPEELAALVGERGPLPDNAALVAIKIIQAGFQPTPSQSLVEKLALWMKALQHLENYLPVRAAWLAWLAAAKLAGNDVLTLARARDRILESLFRRGLRSQYDLPSFLASSGAGGDDRVHYVRDRLMAIRSLVENWVEEPALGAHPRTKAFANLVFAYGLACLGEGLSCDQVVQRAEAALDRPDPIHKWMRDAYQFRIHQALAGKTNAERLPAELFRRLEDMERTSRYKIDRLRQDSRILEPHERIDPYRRWHRRYSDDLGRQLAELHDEHDREPLRQQLEDLIATVGRDKGRRGDYLRVLTRALELSPRLGQTFAVDVLNRVPAVIDGCQEIIGRTLLIEKALLMAANFGQAERVQGLVDGLQQTLPEIVSSYLSLKILYDEEKKKELATIEDLFSQSLRGLRKFGMRDEMGRVLTGVADLLQLELQSSEEEKQMRAWRLLLCVAGGWYFFGQTEAAQEVADRVRETLFFGKLPPHEQKRLANAYVEAIGQAPIDEALPRIEELFQQPGGQRRLQRVKDNMLTVSHFSLAQLELVETTVLTLVGDGFSRDAESRRWLDEEEFLVRRRIHRDVEAAMG